MDNYPNSDTNGCGYSVKLHDGKYVDMATYQQTEFNEYLKSTNMCDGFYFNVTEKNGSLILDRGNGRILQIIKNNAKILIDISSYTDNFNHKWVDCRNYQKDAYFDFIFSNILNDISEKRYSYCDGSVVFDLIFKDGQIFMKRANDSLAAIRNEVGECCVCCEEKTFDNNHFKCEHYNVCAGCAKKLDKCPHCKAIAKNLIYVF
jgi:hypothetical protein